MGWQKIIKNATFAGAVMMLELLAVTGGILSMAVSNAQAGEPDESSEPLVFVVHRSNPVTDLSRGEVRRLFLGQTSHWPNGRRVTLVMRETGQPECTAVFSQLLQMTEAEFNRFMLKSSFVGESQGPPKRVSQGSSVLRFVFNVPGAMGYVLASELNETVKAVRIDGLEPSNPAYPFRVRPR